ncbi:MAG TPA: beta-N-acetylhexosaminidase [Acidobacteriaceae bacterium]|nr:beta-N-acetylhexosaminidase [Acidobacteriaceae bacterium]
MSLRQAVGRALVVGLESLELSKLESAWLRLLQPGGVILFRRNIESAAQTHALLQAASQAVGHPLLRYVDVEGGTVDRLRDLIAPMPSPFAVAATDNPALFEKHGSLIAEEARMLGFTTTFAPVLDLRTFASKGVMTTRVVSGDPDAVARYARYFLKGLARHGVLGCGKHFPGLGSGQVDSHHATPSISKPFDLLWQEDLVPYRKLVKQLPMVMVSHAAYSASGPDPASISEYWIKKVLIRKIGYKGLIVSDDMEMGGILNYMGIAEAAVRAIAAGTEIVEICRDPALIFAAYEGVLGESEKSPAFARLVRRATVKVARAAAPRSRRIPPVPAETAVSRMRTAIERFTQDVARATPA